MSGAGFPVVSGYSISEAGLQWLDLFCQGDDSVVFFLSEMNRRTLNS